MMPCARRAAETSNDRHTARNGIEPSGVAAGVSSLFASPRKQESFRENGVDKGGNIVGGRTAAAAETQAGSKKPLSRCGRRGVARVVCEARASPLLRRRSAPSAQPGRLPSAPAPRGPPAGPSRKICGGTPFVSFRICAVSWGRPAGGGAGKQKNEAGGEEKQGRWRWRKTHLPRGRGGRRLGGINLAREVESSRKWSVKNW